MDFPVNKFSQVSIEQVVDVIAPKERLKRVKRQGSKSPYWLISLTTTPLEYAEGMAFFAYLNSQLGALNNFVLPNPKPEIATHPSAAVSVDAAKGSTTLTFDSAVMPGDFFNVAGHAKTYQIVMSGSADSGGNVTATITPPLMEAVTSGTAIKYGSDAEFQVSLRQTLPAEISANNSKYMIFDIELIEQI